MFIEEILELVELHSVRHFIVGLPGINGLSTEQRKRLTIAVELVANPSIIFMDKPTTGLDARAAAVVMRTVRNTVDTGRTVVCTIHQPSIDIFENFDEVNTDICLAVKPHKSFIKSRSKKLLKSWEPMGEFTFCNGFLKAQYSLSLELHLYISCF